MNQIDLHALRKIHSFVLLASNNTTKCRTTCVYVCAYTQYTNIVECDSQIFVFVYQIT